MKKAGLVGLWLCLVGQLGSAQVAWQAQPGYSYPYGMTRPQGELSIEEQRKLGLSDEQILKIAEKRRELEKERAKLDEQLKAAQGAASAANAEVARINQSIRDLSAGKAVEAVYEAVMTPEQHAKYESQRYLDQAKQWLRGYQSWLKLTDAQVEDISGLLVPVFEKYEKMTDEAAAARETLDKLRVADKLDIAAIEKAEKEVEGLSRRQVYQERQNELMDKMRAGLMPDQIDKLDRIQRR